jgi:hypothetical protein
MPVCARVRVGVPVPIIDAGSVRPNHKKRHRAPPTLRRKIKRQSMRAKHSAPTDRARQDAGVVVGPKVEFLGPETELQAMVRLAPFGVRCDRRYAVRSSVPSFSSFS